MKYDYLIIGGGIAGVTAAETIRANVPYATICIIEDESNLLYSRVLLPHFLKKRVSRDKLFLRTTDDFIKKRIDLRLGTQVLYIDTKRKEVGLGDKVSLGFEKLLIATGGKVTPFSHGYQYGGNKQVSGLSRLQLEVDGSVAYPRSSETVQGEEYLYRLQTIDDADRLYGALDNVKQAMVVGASFISLEFLEIFFLNKIDTTLLARDPYFFGKFLDPQGGEILSSNFERHDIKTQFNDSIGEVAVVEDRVHVTTKGLRKFECELMALGIGLDRNIGFLQGSGIQLGEKGVRVNEYLETTGQEGIFAAGDVAEFYDVIFGKHRLAGNWTNAFLQGKCAGLNMVGKREPFRHVTGYSITNLGLEITILGDCSDVADTTMRVDPFRKEYERFFFHEGILVGAALINRFSDKPHLAKLIDKKISVESYRDQLRDFEFDIREISAVV